MRDMESQGQENPAIQLQNPEQVRVDRDRELCREYIKAGGPSDNTAAARVIHDTSVHRRTFYRALKRQLDWVLANEKGPDVNTAEPNASAPIGAGPTPHSIPQEGKASA